MELKVQFSDDRALVLNRAGVFLSSQPVLPDWTLRDKYDIEAKAPANAIPPNLQDSKVRSRIQQIIRGLLADRFRLVMRVENKTMPVYALIVASVGPKLQKSAVAEKDCSLIPALKPAITLLAAWAIP